MQLPEELRRAIDEYISAIAPSELARASAELTATYRGERRGKPRLDHIHRAAYLLTRLPATYSVLTRVLVEVKLRVPEIRIESLLDLGAGPGTGLWAAAEVFPELSRATLVEADEEWIAAGKQLAQSSIAPVMEDACWIRADVSKQIPAGKFDLVTASYVLNELGPAEMAAVTREAWDRANNILIIVEPGTPSGFAHIREMRRELIDAGAQMVAPCPHIQTCPMPPSDWCHFAQRVQRTSGHRVAKAGDLGYEDEKYSYAVFARKPVDLPEARIVRHPRKHAGHVEFEVCTTGGLQRATLSKKHGEKYKQGRKLEWGETLPK